MSNISPIRTSEKIFGEIVYGVVPAGAKLSYPTTYEGDNAVRAGKFQSLRLIDREGLIFTSEPAKEYFPGCEVYLIEYAVNQENDAVRIRLLKRLDKYELAGVNIFTSGLHWVPAGQTAVAAGSATVGGRTNAKSTIRAFDNSKVIAHPSTVVEAQDNATVRATYSKVTAKGKAQINAFYTEVRCSGDVAVLCDSESVVKASGKSARVTRLDSIDKNSFFTLSPKKEKQVKSNAAPIPALVPPVIKNYIFH